MSKMEIMRAEARSADFRIAAVETATQCLGEISPGCRIIGMTKGQVSMLDLLRALLAQTGPAEVVISTWTTGIRDAENAKWLVEDGVILSLFFLTDRSFATRQPGYAARMVELFGADSIRVTNTHAKFAMIANEKWKIVVRCSMNLNKNSRFEQFDIDDDPAIYDFFLRMVEEIAGTTPPGFDVSGSRIHSAFKNSLGGGLAESAHTSTAQDLAELSMTDKQIAKHLGISLAKLKQEHGNAIQEGRNMADIEYRKTVHRLAKAGNSAAWKQLQTWRQAASGGSSDNFFDE